MFTSRKKWLYAAVGAAAVVLLVAGVPVSTVLAVVLVSAMLLMHLGGHGGHGGHGGGTGTQSGHRHDDENTRPLSRP